MAKLRVNVNAKELLELTLKQNLEEQERTNALIKKCIEVFETLEHIEHYAWLELDDTDDADSIRLQMIRDVLTGGNEE